MAYSSTNLILLLALHHVTSTYKANLLKRKKIINKQLKTKA
ncbi:Putative uncharacterized protein [Moritella viscosa]|uniref:Uncharacterized protein n=1 Tax=Moritella viscosa TaxID=80854 RepID=A0ABY1HBC1_9GAMM|nr:Putative uncharacterized protein [Moritella viscosa]SGY83159.1 Putative uncharacterized protein [Moritella viscosa]SGY83228.1 Putative uncharacterized protein [Moritella viscosa]SGY83836.1 Putative uncharacterized protein [Moritella viscosa]SHO24282.1 Putative uncharacterized protein [Moritella viscosa]